MNAPVVPTTVRKHAAFVTFDAMSEELGYAAASRLVVAVSGGGDSVALALVAGTWARERMKDICFGYFDHETEPTRNRAEWRLVKELGGALSIPAWRGSASHYRDIVGRGPEETWRRQRYRFLRSLAGRDGIILTGHTMDDAAETFLLAAVRGGSGGALSGLRNRRTDGVVRPFLGIRRKQLRDLLQKLGVEWIEDLSNRDERGARVFVRQRILPLLISRFGEKSVNGIARSARWFEELNDLADGFVQQAVSKPFGIGHDDDTRLDLGRLRSYHPSVQRRALRKVLAERFTDPCSRLSHPVDQLLRLIATGRAGSLTLPEGLQAVIRGDLLVLQKPVLDANRGMVRAVYIPVPGCVWLERTRQGIAASTIWCGSRTFDSFSFGLGTALLDGDELCGALRIRRRRPGERFKPLGAFTGTVKLKKYLRDRGIPVSERWHVPIVTDCSGELLWIPGIARSGRARMTNHTRRAIMLRTIREERLERSPGE